MEYIKREWKKLGSLSFLGLGTFLVGEHIYTYGGIDLWDLLGHEVLGIVFIIIGILWANRWGRLKMEEGLAYTMEKINYIFNRK